MRAEPTDTPASPPPPSRRLRRWLVYGLGGLVVVGAAAGYAVWRQVDETLSPAYTDVAYTVPEAPRLTAGSGETLYRINPRESQLRYEIQEKLFGKNSSTATGTTQGIAGDVVLDETAMESSRVGRIAVNVEQLHSDNNLRDARLRSEYLESKRYPLVELETLAIAGLSGKAEEGKPYEFSLETTASVRGKLVPLTWQVEATLSDGELEATASTTAKLSDIGAGPISIAGLVSTSDDVKLTMKLVAQDPSRYDIPTTIEAPEGVRRSGEGPSFAKTIQPILQASCASCHVRGEVGAKHWELMTAADAAEISDGIGSVVQNLYMPPWPASDVGVPLAHSKRLKQADVDAIVAWAKAGGPLDVSSETRIVPDEVKAGTQPRADLTLRMPEAYTGSGEIDNDYRCFLLDPKITRPTYLRGFQVTPQTREQIHHVQIFHTDAVQAERGKAISGQDGRPGWECFGTGSLGPPGRGDAPGRNMEGFSRRPIFSNQPGLIAGWVPGQDPILFPDNSGILLMPGDQLVFQLHYHFDDKPVPDRSSVALQLDRATRDIKPIDIVNPLAPVEIPCEPGDKAPLCDRDASLRESFAEYGGAAFTANALHFLCGTSIEEVAARARNGVPSTECTYRVPENGRIVSVFGHMHTIGKAFRLTLHPGEAREKILLDIPNWNFNWQMNYDLETPIAVKAGDVLHMECSWDRAADPNREPRYIFFAEGTEDEMCFATYAIIPDEY